MLGSFLSKIVLHRSEPLSSTTVIGNRRIIAHVSFHLRLFLLILILLASCVFDAAPVGRVYGAVGHPVLGTVNAVPSPGVLTSARSNVTVLLGSMYVTAIDGVAVDPVDNLLAINFTGVTFSGTEFYLILSQNGLASQSAGDIRYSPTFTISQFAANLGKLAAETNANGTFWIGEYGAYDTPMVVGPIPVQLTPAYKYIKVYDGNTGAEATASQQIIIAPSETATTTTTATFFSTATSRSTVSATIMTTLATTLPTTVTTSAIESETVTTTQLTTQIRSVSFTTISTELESTTGTTIETTTVTSTTSLSNASSSTDFDYALVAAVAIVCITIIIWFVLGSSRTGRIPN